MVKITNKNPLGVILLRWAAVAQLVSGNIGNIRWSFDEGVEVLFQSLQSAHLSSLIGQDKDKMAQHQEQYGAQWFGQGCFDMLTAQSGI